jgi:putative flavoprotein involved in K+ transport
LHSSQYRNLSQLRPGGVLLVGAGNSGADIALEAARSGRVTWLAGRCPGELLFRPERFLGRHVLQPLVLGVVFHRLLTVDTALGRRVRPTMLTKTVPLIRVKSRELGAAGVKRTPRVAGVREGLPLLEDGQTLAAASVIWSTGFESGFEWIELPAFGQLRMPLHRSGLVDNCPGLYFVGLDFLHAVSSAMIHGVGRDAARIVQAITTHAAGRPSQRQSGAFVAHKGRHPRDLITRPALRARS